MYRTSVRDGWLGKRSSSSTRERYHFGKLNNSPCSELVMGVHHIKWRQPQNCINLEINVDKGEFSTKFSRPQTSRIGGAPLQYYPKILQSDIFCFPEPAVDHSSQLHYQHRDHEDRGVIYPPNFDTPSPVSKPVQPTLAGHTMHDGDVLHMGNILDVTKQELLEFQPSCYTHKVNIYCFVESIIYTFL